VCFVEKTSLKGVPMKKNSIALLHEFCQLNSWSIPVECVVSESGEQHERTYCM